MEKMAIMTIIILSAMVLISLTFVSAWGRGHSRSPVNEADITAIPELELTGEQVVQIRTLRETHLKDIGPLQNDMREKREELRRLWLQKSPDQNKIGVAKAEIGVLRDRMHDKIANYRQMMLRILTPNQQVILQSAMQQQEFNSGLRWRKEGRSSP
jgi:Spy/CpxP family protein refolding chaperone